MHGNIANDMKIVAGQTSPEDALSAGNYPASGSYIDVSGYEWVNVILHMGAIHASDTPKFILKQTDSASGTLDTISTADCVHTCAADDDDEFVSLFLGHKNSGYRPSLPEYHRLPGHEWQLRRHRVLPRWRSTSAGFAGHGHPADGLAECPCGLDDPATLSGCSTGPDQ